MITEGRTGTEVEFNPACKPESEEPRVVLRAAGLKRSFGKVHAVDGLDLTVRAGEIYGFLGINGAGKTTAIRMLMGIIKPDEGTIELMGEQARRTTIRQKQSIGYVSQEQTFYPWMTCRGLGRFVGGFYPTWDAPEFDRLLRVLDLPPDRKASQLSGGMRVKLALALALAPRPALLILDEPTSGLDPVGRREFLDIIQRQARDHGRTTFFSSHIIGEVERVADRVGIIHHGRMHFEGTLDALRASVRAVRLPVPVIQPPPAPPVIGAPETTAGEPGVAVAETPTVSGRDFQRALHHWTETKEQTALPFEKGEGELPAIQAVPGLEPFMPPAGFAVLRDETRENVRSLVLRAPPEAWENFQPPGAEVGLLSVEDIFIALVGTAVAEI